ncbi:MAG: EAL domain-containing protein [Acidimicrobiales bacterium]|nr:EAL domain-containing protein [Acidimicrobiales bacterium]
MRTPRSRREPKTAPRETTGRWTGLLPFAVLLGVLVVTASALVVRQRALRVESANEEASAVSVFVELLSNSAFRIGDDVSEVESTARWLQVHFAGQGGTDSAPTADEVRAFMTDTGAAERLVGLLDVVVTTDVVSSGGEGVSFTHGDPSGESTLTASVEIGSPSGQTSRIDLVFRASAVLTEPTSGFVTGATPAPGEALQPLPSVERLPDNALGGRVVVELFDHPYAIEARTRAGFVREPSRRELAVIVAVGAMLAVVAFAVAHTLVRARTRALELVAVADAARDASNRRFRASFEHAPIGMAELSADGRLIEANAALATQSGRSRADLVGVLLDDVVHPQDRIDHEREMQALLSGERDAIQAELRYLRPDNTEAWIAESVSAVPNADGAPRTFLVQAQDITARRRAAWELARQAMHDELTGLPNRALFLNRLKHALERARRSETLLAVMFIDVDRFKLVNDSLGHEQGDRFLMEVSRRIGTAVRGGDTVARFGGDEFVVLCEEVTGASEAMAVAQRIQSELNRPLELAGSNVHATASIGITLNQHGDDSADSLLRDADAAMYRAKDGGRNRTEVFDAAMRTSVVERMVIESDLRHALANGEIVMHYQAIVDPLTHLPVGYEALMRWHHPTRGLLTPGAFLDVASNAGMIERIDSYALQQTCRQIAEWSQRFPAARHLYVATNWSARDLSRFVQQVDQVLSDTRIDPEQLVVEVTETFLLADSDASIEAIAQLKALGVSVAIDDFGTGYSSLSYLTQFDIDHLKIDKSFVDRLPDDHATAAVISAISDMAHVLGIKVVAEGVETDEQFDALLALGAPRLQGYRFAKPRPADEITAQLAERFDPIRLRQVAAPILKRHQIDEAPVSPFVTS